ncbi:MAG: RIP metalloprotease RseP [Spirochaetae bacterium HGW-Spirochaetae-7]|nr:MAG: RIP metalloprotease RseP [Spirochaetae bacterium HGW-Spirochaetae-7]
MAVGYEVKSYENRIILASQYDGGRYPADIAGLKSGDRITSINGKQVSVFSEIQEAVSLSAKRLTTIGIDRSGTRIESSLRPEMNKDTGAGRIGVYPWIEPVIGIVDPAGPAALAGLRAGDRILSVAGQPIVHTVALSALLEKERPERVDIAYLRAGQEESATLVLSYIDGAAADLGIGWKTIDHRVRASGFADAVSMGFVETVKTISGTYRGIASLFMGVNLLKAVSGPARITWMVGTVAKNGLSGETAGGLSAALGFLAILSIGLFAMNLLPIPLLDGGSILLFVIEIVRRKAAKVKTVLRYQTVGIVTVAAIFLLSTVGDFIFFSGK